MNALYLVLVLLALSQSVSAALLSPADRNSIAQPHRSRRRSADKQDCYSAGTLWDTAVGLPLVYPDWLGPDHPCVYYRVAVAF